jgi:hypothetical protein
VPEVVSLAAPYDVRLVTCDPQPLVPASVRVRTWYSGVSAGTELTAYRGSNPYLTRSWDAGRRLFVGGVPPSAYPVQGWGYSEVGEVVEVAEDVTRPAVGDVVHGMWGHRSEAGGLRSFSDRLADLDPWGLATVRDLVAAGSRTEPFGAAELAEAAALAQAEGTR